MIRQKNRIKSQLHYLGAEIQLEYIEPYPRWSKRFIVWLKEVSMPTSIGYQASGGIASAEIGDDANFTKVRQYGAISRVATVDRDYSGCRSGYGEGVFVRDMRYITIC